MRDGECVSADHPTGGTITERGAGNYYAGTTGARYFENRGRSRSTLAQQEMAALYRPYIFSEAVVIDFGCGTGGILASLPCKRRIGIEVNELAAVDAAQKGIEVASAVLDVSDTVADVAIANHSLEHVEDPFRVLTELRCKLKKGGRIVVTVPVEEPLRKRYRHWRENVEQHLYCWSPLTLGNLLLAAGYDLENAFIWPGGNSHYLHWARRFPLMHKWLKRCCAVALRRYHVTAVARA